MIDEKKVPLSCEALAVAAGLLSKQVTEKMLEAKHSVAWRAVTIAFSDNEIPAFVIVAFGDEAKRQYSLLQGAGHLCSSDIGLGFPQPDESPFAIGAVPIVFTFPDETK